MKRQFAGTWPFFVLLAAGPALLAGIGIMLRGGAPWWYPVVNTVAFAVGLSALALPIHVRRFIGAHLAELSLIGVLLILATLLDPGIDGVHRWALLGPLRLHPSAVLSPLVLLGIAQAFKDARRALAFGLVTGLQGIHLVQPDAGQSTAVALGVVVVALLPSKTGLATRLAIGVVAIVSCISTWIRPAPLPPVHFVEDAVSVAWSQGWSIGLMATASLSLLAVGPWSHAGRRARTKETSFALIERGTRPVAPAVALGIYMAATCIVAAVGNFPVPLVGYGGSPVLGAVLGFMALGWLPNDR